MNSATDDSATTARAGHTTVIHGPEATHEGLCALVAKAESHIQVFGPILEPMLFSTARLTEALTHFLSQSRRNRVEFLVEDSQQVLRDNARLLGVLQKLSDYAELRELGEADHGQRDLFVCVDRRHYLHQPDISRPECLLGHDNRDTAIVLAHRFSDCWHRAAPVALSRTLGL